MIQPISVHPVKRQTMPTLVRFDVPRVTAIAHGNMYPNVSSVMSHAKIMLPCPLF